MIKSYQFIILKLLDQFGLQHSSPTSMIIDTDRLTQFTVVCSPVTAVCFHTWEVFHFEFDSYQGLNTDVGHYKTEQKAILRNSASLWKGFSRYIKADNLTKFLLFKQTFELEDVVRKGFLEYWKQKATKCWWEHISSPTCFTNNVAKYWCKQ